ncbi:MAG: DUF481 domain-containing protein [Phenylobacterium sp.]|nr:DUF481 domain-containing protein [Phenylobacterium sp.]
MRLRPPLFVLQSVATVVAFSSGAAVAGPLPAEVARMLSAAAETGQLGPVSDVARRAYPDAAGEIDAQVAALQAKAETERADRLATQRFHQGWTGEGHAGGFVSSGNTEDIGVSAGLSFIKETLRWRHDIKVASEYQQSSGDVSKERYAAAYAGQWKLSGRAFVALSLSAERDRFAGYKSRFSESVGLGYTLIDRPDLRLDVQAGPALRQISYYSAPDEVAFAGRLGGDLTWTLRPELVLTQSTTAFLDSVSSTLTSTTALTTKLRDDLSARTSFDLRMESDPPVGRKGTDTTLRTSLVYSF